MHSAFISGCAGTVLTNDEKSFFRDRQPAGFILFERNCSDKAQLSALVESVFEALQSDDLLVLIDQEGGRVQRLVPPHWRQYPAALELAEICERDERAGFEAIHIVNRAIAQDLKAVGINMNCTPILDIPVEGAHDIIGNRAFGLDAENIAKRARIAANAHLECGVLPVIKHIPGHGRSTSDSHKSLPIVDAERRELDKTDFLPFKSLSDLPVAMTAHIIYSAIDKLDCASLSAIIINDIIRQHIGFSGLLMSDDLSMKALSGDMAARTRGVLSAGCDLALHCNGDFAEMQQVADNAPELSAAGKTRFHAALELINGKNAQPNSVEDAKLEALLEKIREKS